MIYHHAPFRTYRFSTASARVWTRRRRLMYPHMFRWLFDVRSSRSQLCRVFRKITELIWYYILAFIHKLPGPARTTAVYECGKLIIHNNNSKRELYSTVRTQWISYAWPTVCISSSHSQQQNNPASNGIHTLTTPNDQRLNSVIYFIITLINLCQLLHTFRLCQQHRASALLCLCYTVYCMHTQYAIHRRTRIAGQHFYPMQ